MIDRFPAAIARCANPADVAVPVGDPGEAARRFRWFATIGCMCEPVYRWR